MKEERQRLNASYTADDNARSHTLAWIVIGGILLVCAGVFLWMSFKRNEIGLVLFRPNSMEFIACLASAAVALFGLLYGGIRTILLTRRMKKTKVALDELKRK